MDQISLSETEIVDLKNAFNSFVTTKTLPALSTLLGENISFKIKKTQQVELSELEQLVPAFDDMISMAGIYISCEGDVRMGILFYLPEDEAKKLAAKLLKQDELEKFSKLEMSSLTEMGNILAASFFNTLSIDKGCKTVSSVPGFALDTFRTLLECPAMEMGMISSSLVIADGELHSENSGSRIRMLIVQEPKESRKVLSIAQN